MRPPRLLFLLACLIFLPILLTTLSLLSAHTRQGAAATSPASRQSSRLRTLFSFHAPSALFPPSAVISLTEDNSTFFLARPAAFGPLLPSKGLSGPLWIGSGFGDETLRRNGIGVTSEGELGCSDVPGWENGNNQKNIQLEAGPPKSEQPDQESTQSIGLNGYRKRSDEDRNSGATGPSRGDGTDDHLHHPLPQSDPPISSISRGADHPSLQQKAATHADIKSLQESAEISGKIVLLSRGGCGFLEKVKWAQRRGGVAVIVGDDTRGGGLVTMYARGDTSNVTIPAVFTSYTTAHLLSSLVPQTKLIDPSKNAPGDGKQKQKPAFQKTKSTSNEASKPTATPLRKSSPGSAYRDHHGFFNSLAFLLGFSQRNGHHSTLHEDSRRPPSSGNLEWTSHDKNTKPKQAGSAGLSRSEGPGHAKPASDDEFIIGVQDWRDPDLIPVKRSTSVSAIATPATNVNGRNERTPQSFKHILDSSGGTTPPRSGEYKASSDKVEPVKPTKEEKPSDEHWWKGLGGSKHDDNDLLETKFDKPSPQYHGAAGSPPKDETDDNHDFEREGLWVTLTPTSMSTSPFFDTLLVLVVSPLITLTVVYALLLLRSRIRRRRWRAPKAIVDRLPVRTYHTMSTVSTPTTASPDASSPSSPLLSHSRPHSPRPRPRSQTCGPISASSNSLDPGHRVEKPRSGSTLWRRKYTGRQVECVVCLEEYIDGQSRVMSLPCGHEFHVECM